MFHTATKSDLDELVSKGVLTLEGRGRGAHYTKMKKRLINGSNGSCLCHEFGPASRGERES